MTAYSIIMALVVLFCGGILAITPSLMPPTECFTITVPPSAQSDPRIKSLRKTFAVIIIAVSAVCALGLALFLLGQIPESRGDMTCAAAIVVATIVPLLLGFVLMLAFRSRVRKIKEEEGWTATANTSVAIVGDDSAPQPFSLAWNVLHLVLVGIIVVFTLTSYDRFPEQIPMKTDLDGNVISWAPKSHISVLVPAFIAAFMGLAFTFCHWSILRSKRPIDPAAPATSALAYGTFARTQSIVLLVGGLGLNAGICVLTLLSFLGSISMMTATIALLALTLAFVIAEVWVSIAQGQSGGRIAAELRTSDEIGYDDDAHWPLGAFYCNREDPAVFVPKRFGVGWTFNIARPTGWVALGLLVALAIGLGWAIEVLVK